MNATTLEASEIRARATVVSLPLRTAFRGLRHREVMLIDGPNGLGEWAAFTEYSDDEAAWWLATALEQAYAPPALDWSTAINVPVNAIVPALPSSEVERWLGDFEGCTAIKVKVGEAGQSVVDDLERVREVRRVVGDHPSLRLDANGSWGISDALLALKELAPFDIDYIEQPVQSIEQMAELKEILDLPIRFAADEVVRRSHTIDHVDREVVDVVVVKPSPLGGYHYSKALAMKALGRGFEVVVSSALESSVGLSHAALLAGELNRTTGVPTAHGLSTALLFDTDITPNPLHPLGGVVTPLEPKPDWDALATLRVVDDREDWWFQRLERCLPGALELVNHRPE